MIVNNNLTQRRYDDMLYDSRPVKFSEFISNKYNIIHSKLYNMALNEFINDWLKAKHTMVKDEEESDEQYYERCKKFINSDKNMMFSCGQFTYNVESLNEFKQYSYIYEIREDEYWKPSKIKIMTKTHNGVGNLSWTVDLTKYWNTYQRFLNKKIDTKKISLNKNLSDSELIDLNYITGIATMYSKSNDFTYTIPFEYLDENTPVSDLYSLRGHFSQNISF